MTVLKFVKSESRPDRRGLSACGHPRASTGVQVSIARSFGDFMEATPLLRKMADEPNARIAADSIGRFLSRLNHGASGPDTGCVLLARIDGKPVGFAVLLPKDKQTIELAWLHPGDRMSDVVLDAIWKKVSDITAEWDVPLLQVGAFVLELGTANPHRSPAIVTAAT